MSIELKKLNSFKDFILKQQNQSDGIYLLTLAIESYYELISEILVPNSSRSVTQFKLLEELRASKSITEQEFAIMNETRKFKNNLTHRLDYEPDINFLHDFYNNCSLTNKRLPKDKNNQEELEKMLQYALLKSDRKSVV